MKRHTLAASLCLAFLPMAYAETTASPYSLADAITQGQSLSSFRLRYENVEQQGLSKDANATTLRTLLGWQTAPMNGLSVGLQVINVAKLQDDYNDKASGVDQPGHASYPVVADPDFTAINQLYLDWTSLPDTKLRLGRQSVKLDNVRFIGNVEFRQVMQVFDGASVTNKTFKDVELYSAWFTGNRNINTDFKHDHTGILHASWRFSPTETLTGYGYFYDQNNVAVASDLSSRTLGARADGARPLSTEWKWLYTAEYAKQDAWAGSRDRSAAQGQIDAHYYRVGTGVGWQDWSVRVDQELLSSNNYKYAFQTPLGTNHLFQGWVDKFLVTPDAGIRDTFITASGKLGGFKLLTEYHWLDSDVRFDTTGTGTRNGTRYGAEWDVGVSYDFRKDLLGKIEYGNYTEKDPYFNSSGANKRYKDTQKLWITMLYSF